MKEASDWVLGVVWMSGGVLKSGSIFVSPVSDSRRRELEEAWLLVDSVIDSPSGEELTLCSLIDLTRLTKSSIFFTKSSISFTNDSFFAKIDCSICNKRSFKSWQTTHSWESLLELLWLEFLPTPESIESVLSFEFLPFCKTDWSPSLSVTDVDGGSGVSLSLVDGSKLVRCAWSSLSSSHAFCLLLRASLPPG